MAQAPFWGPFLLSNSMTNLSFTAQIEQWVADVKEAAEAVRDQSAQEVVEEMVKPVAKGGRMRVDTGFLRNSLLASTSAMPSINPAASPIDGQTYSLDVGQIEAAITGAALEDTLYFGFTASYAAAREYGARGQAPDAFVRSAAQKWPEIVERNAREVKSRFGL